MKQIAQLQEQIEHIEIVVIRETLDLIQSSKSSTIRNFVRANVERSIQWCRRHGEEISLCWLTDLERNVNKETEDLIHILHPNPHANIVKPQPVANISFEGFRSGIVHDLPSGSNPFMRIKKFPMVYHS
jgi:hypothetical protein